MKRFYRIQCNTAHLHSLAHTPAHIYLRPVVKKRKRACAPATFAKHPTTVPRTLEFRPNAYLYVARAPGFDLFFELVR